jgi:hypothetical protein
MLLYLVLPYTLQVKFLHLVFPQLARDEKWTLSRLTIVKESKLVGIGHDLETFWPAFGYSDTDEVEARTQSA